MGIFSGLEKMGFKPMGKVDLFEEEKQVAKKKAEAEKTETKELSEFDLLYDKSMTCPVCEHEFKTRAVVSSKAKRDLPDLDMRPKFVGIDILKYDVIVCRKCGFAALSSYFKESLLTDNQIMMIRENVSANYTPQADLFLPTYSYDEAIDNHKLALYNAVVKKAKASEKAYVCLKTAWLYRGKRESYFDEASDYETVTTECIEAEKEYLEEAKKGFLYALSHEGGKICGMEPPMVEYLCAAICYDLEEYDEGMKILSKLITNTSTSTQLKEKCRDLKEAITEAQK